MRCAALVLVLACAALGCGDKTPTVPPISEEDPGAASAPEGQGESTFYFFDESASDEGNQKPSFEMRGEITVSAERVVSFENTRSIIRSRAGEEVHIAAAQGRYDPNAQTAIMEGGVVMGLDTMRIELQDLTWVNETQTAKSDNPVKITDGPTVLEASSMEYARDSESLVLRDMKGTIEMEGGKTP